MVWVIGRFNYREYLFMSTITTNLERAILDLHNGKPVAIPTETVYGLAAMIDKPEAIKAVFAIKERPLNHPLIVHVADDWDLKQIVCEIPAYAQQLINAFWPGALTLVFNSKPLNPLITGGQTTVAIRSPSHPLAQQLLKKLAMPVVAPSANPFGKVSPTTADHVAQSFAEQDLLILEGGRCSIGIESTIVDATHPTNYQILRHGIIDERQIAAVISGEQTVVASSVRVPGKLDSHYQPHKHLYYFDDYQALADFCHNQMGRVYTIASQKPASVHQELYHPLAADAETAAYDLYYQLRAADASKALCIAIELPPAASCWHGVRERILKAGMPFSAN